MAVLAVVGGLTAPIALIGLPLLILSLAGRFTLACVIFHLGALGVRLVSLLDASRHLDQPEPPLAALASAVLFVPESLYRALAMRGGPPTVEIWRSGSASLSICGVPSLALVRSLAREAHAQPVRIVSLCAWWRGFPDAYDALGLEHSRFCLLYTSPSPRD